MVWSNKVGDGKNKCVERRAVYTIYIGERGQPPMRGAASLYSFSPLHGGGNPLLDGKVTPLIK
jgi:hypothetical protein